MKNKKIIIIGGTGALGKTLIKKYHKDNTIMIISVCIIATYCGHLFCHEIPFLEYYFS